MLRSWCRVGIGCALACTQGCRGSARDEHVECPEVQPAEPTRVAEDEPTPPASPPSPPSPTALSEVLQGPVADLDAEIRGRVLELPEDCDPPSEQFPRGEVRATASAELSGPALEVRLMRYPGDIACAPIEYCALAIRTASGWWVTPHDESSWCQGVTGPSSRVSVEDEDVAADEQRPGVVAHTGFRLLATRDYGTTRDGPKQERWSETRTPFARLCEVTSDDRVHCQVEAPVPVW